MIRDLPFPARAAVPLGLQLALLLAGLLTAAFAPPARGAMLLVPLTGAARADLPALALAHGALLIGRGPIEGSLLVRGERAALGEALMRRGVLPVAAPASWCGQARRSEQA